MSPYYPDNEDLFGLKQYFSMELGMNEDVQATFGEIKWCNMGLLSLRSERGHDKDDIVLEIVDLYSGANARFDIRFIDSTYLSLEIDFASKRTCADAFDGGDCRLESPWKKALTDANPYDNFSLYFHFRLGLVPKGEGRVNKSARLGLRTNTNLGPTTERKFDPIEACFR